MEELNDEFFEKNGFDISKEPFTKEVVDGTAIDYKNYIRDGSSRYEGYIVVKPKARVVKTVDDYLSA